MSDENRAGAKHRMERPDRLAAPEHPALRSLGRAGKNAQQRCLAASVRAADEERRAGAQRETHAGKKLRIATPRGKVVRFKHRSILPRTMATRIIAEQSLRAAARSVIADQVTDERSASGRCADQGTT
jgi:hypothetical protein